MTLTKKSIPYSKEELLSKLVKYCAYQERCLSDVVTKLSTLKAKDSEIGDITDYLLHENYINEERFTRVYVRGKFRSKKWGKYKIRQHLKMKKIPENLISKTIQDEIDGEEYFKALQLLTDKKFHQLRSKTKESQYKVARYLQGKGYEGDLIWEAIKLYLAA